MAGNNENGRSRATQFGNQLPPEQELVLEKLRGLEGLSCELKSTTNRLLAMGKLQAVEERAVRVVSLDGSEMPVTLYNNEVKLIIRPPKEQVLILCGFVCGSSPSLWKIDRLQRFNFVEARRYFRQIVNIKAKVGRVVQPQQEQEPEDNRTECVVLDMSLEGLRLQSGQRFERGELVQITELYLLPEHVVPFEAVGEICWADHIGGGKFLFGCHLRDMSEAQQDTLCAAIFQLQREELQAKRLGNRRNF